jgi:hypothetical protein
VKKFFQFVRTWIFRRSPRPEQVEEKSLAPPAPGAVVRVEPRALHIGTEGITEFDGPIPYPDLPAPPEPEPLAPASTFFEKVFKARPWWLFDSVHLAVRCNSVLRVKAFLTDKPDTVILMTIISPRTDQIDAVMFLGMHSGRAEQDVTIQVEGPRPFEVFRFDATYMRPAFKREQNADGEMVLVFMDPFYQPLLESEVGVEHASPHHRKLYGPGRDVGYR